jgi:hypothetical protein
LQSDVIRVGEAIGTSHRYHVNGHHLRHQHGLGAIPGLDAFDHGNHEGEPASESGWSMWYPCDESFTCTAAAALALPDVSKCFCGIGQSTHCQRHVTLHGVVFDILGHAGARVHRPPSPFGLR